MSKFSTRAKLVAAGAVVMTALGGGVAFAYWSTTGSGTGTGSTSSGASSLTVTQTTAPTDLAPGVAAEPISGTVKNTATNNAYVSTVTVSIASVAKAAGAAAGTCDATDYTLSNPAMTVNTDLTPGQTITFTGATLGFNDKTTSNQDACKGATVNLAYSTN
jgi:hypothetical protein